jgi:LysM repeat protein
LYHRQLIIELFVVVQRRLFQVLKSLLFMAIFSYATVATGAELVTQPNNNSAVNVIEPMVTPRWMEESSVTPEPVVEVKSAVETVPPPITTPPPTVDVVKSGDTLTSIAERHQTTYNRLFDANPEISNPNILNVGATIRIPLPDEVLVTRALPTPVITAPTVRTAVSSAQPNTAPAVASGSVWDQLARCESGGNWSINTGNGYYGGLQFSLSTWRAVGGSGLPSENSREEQIARAEILLARSGWGQWPACTTKLGLR